MRYLRGVPRSGAEARRRLQQAALELYRERGFDQTTTAEIAARAGVNERTFFRHFPDKREVLFDGEADLRAALTQEVADAPDEPAATRAFCCAPSGKPDESLRTTARSPSHGWRSSPRRQPCANVTWPRPQPLTEAIAEALRQRDVPDRLAGLAAQTGWATFHHAAQAWIDDPSQSLDAHLLQAFDDLHALSATVPPEQARPES